jgi:hypothetical protein
VSDVVCRASTGRSADVARKVARNEAHAEVARRRGYRRVESLALRGFRRGAWSRPAAGIQVRRPAHARGFQLETVCADKGYDNIVVIYCPACRSGSPGQVLHPVSELPSCYGASAEQETSDFKHAYTRFELYGDPDSGELAELQSRACASRQVSDKAGAR